METMQLRSAKRQGNASPVITVQVPNRTRPTAPGGDAEMMYAWSLASPRPAVTLFERPISRFKDECPPEVYIG